MESAVKRRTKSSWFDLSNIKDKNGKPLKTKTKTELLKICLENHKEYGLDSYDFCNNFVSILKKYVYDEEKKVYTEYPLADKKFCGAVFSMLEKTDKNLVKRYAFSIFMSIFLPGFYDQASQWRSHRHLDYRFIIVCLTEAIVSASHNFCDLRISSDFMKGLCEYTKNCKYIITSGECSETENSFCCYVQSSDYDPDEETRQFEAITAIISCYMSMLLNETDKLFSVSYSQKQKAQCWFDTFCTAIKNFFDTKMKELDKKNVAQLDFFKFVFEEFFIQSSVKFKKEYGLITDQDIKNLIDVIDRCFSSNKDTQSRLILYLFTQFDFFKDFAGIKTGEQSYYEKLMDDLYNSDDSTKNDQIDKIKNLYLNLLSYTNASQLSKKNDKEKGQFYFDKFMIDAKSLFDNELKKHKKNEQDNMPPDFQLSLKFAISMAMDIKINADLAITYNDIFIFADIIYKYFPSNKDIQSEMILYLFEQFDIIKDMYKINCVDKSGEFSFNNLWYSLDGAKTEAFWGTLKMFFKGRKGLVSLFKGDWFNFNNLLPEALLKQVENYNSENKVITDKPFNLEDQVFKATNDIWEKLGQILQLCIIKNTKNNDLKFLNLSAVFGFLRDKGFNVCDYIVKLEKLYSHIFDALLKGLVGKFENMIEKNNLSQYSDELPNEEITTNDNDYFKKYILINTSMKQTYAKIIKSLTVNLFKSLLDEKNVNTIIKTKDRKDNNENKNIANEINIISDKRNSDENKYKQDINVVAILLDNIVDVLLKRFGSLYGFIRKFEEAVVHHDDGDKILAILNFVIDFIFDKDKDSEKSIASLLMALLNRIDWSAILTLTSAQKKEIPEWFSLYYLILITCTKLLDCETNIYQKKSWFSRTTPKLKITNKLIVNLKQIMSDKNFIELVNYFGIDKENLSKIPFFLDNISNLKVEDCLCILYLAVGIPEPEQNLNLVFDLARKFHKEYSLSNVQTISDTKKNKIITRDKNVFDIMDRLDEVKKVNDELKKSADIQLKIFIWTFKNRLQFLFEKTNLLLTRTKTGTFKDQETILTDFLVCSYILSNLLKFVCDDRFGDAIIEEISSTDISKNREEKKDEPSWTEKWVLVFKNFNEIFDKCKILGIDSIFFKMDVSQPENSKNIVNDKYGTYTYLKNILDVLKYFIEAKAKFYPKKPKENDDIFNKFKINLEQFCKRATKAVADAKKKWKTSSFEPEEKKNTDIYVALRIAQNYKSFNELCTNFEAFCTKSSDNDGKIISMELKNLFNYFQKLWTWLDFTFGTYNFYITLKLNKHEYDDCNYCKKFDNISLVINYIYENRIALQKSDSDDNLLAALCSVKELFYKVTVHEDKKITLKNLKERLSDTIYYFRYLKDREKERDKKEILKSNTEKKRINEINYDQNTNIDKDKTDGTDKNKNENKNTINLLEKSIVQKSDYLLKIPKENFVSGCDISKQNMNKNIKSDDTGNINLNLDLDTDQINTSANDKIQNEQVEKQLNDNVIDGNNITDVKNSKKSEINEINQKENKNKNDIVIKRQASKNGTVENKSNNQQQKNKLDSQSVETKLVVYKPNQFLKFDDIDKIGNKIENIGNINNRESSSKIKNEEREPILKIPKENFSSSSYISKQRNKDIESDYTDNSNLKIEFSDENEIKTYNNNIITDKSKKISSANNAGADLKDQESNQNPNQKNLCFLFIFIGIIFFIIAALFLTNIIWAWFVMNLIAQLAIMIFSVVFACICIFMHKSLRQKLSSWQKQKYHDQTISKIDISYDQHKKTGDEKTNSDVSPKSEETNRVCPFCSFWK